MLNQNDLCWTSQPSAWSCSRCWIRMPLTGITLIPSPVPPTLCSRGSEFAGSLEPNLSCDFPWGNCHRLNLLRELGRERDKRRVKIQHDESQQGTDPEVSVQHWFPKYTHWASLIYEQTGLLQLYSSSGSLSGESFLSHTVLKHYLLYSCHVFHSLLSSCNLKGLTHTLRTQ